MKETAGAGSKFSSTGAGAVVSSGSGVAYDTASTGVIHSTTRTGALKTLPTVHSTSDGNGQNHGNPGKTSVGSMTRCVDAPFALSDSKTGSVDPHIPLSSPLVA